MFKQIFRSALHLSHSSVLHTPNRVEQWETAITIILPSDQNSHSCFASFTDSESNPGSIKMNTAIICFDISLKSAWWSSEYKSGELIFRLGPLLLDASQVNSEGKNEENGSRCIHPEDKNHHLIRYFQWQWPLWNLRSLETTNQCHSWQRLSESWTEGFLSWLHRVEDGQRRAKSWQLDSSPCRQAARRTSAAFQHQFKSCCGLSYVGLEPFI